MRTTPKAVLFDMDGTLVDWQSNMDETWLAACESQCDGTYEPQRALEAIVVRRNGSGTTASARTPAAWT